MGYTSDADQRFRDLLELMQKDLGELIGEVTQRKDICWNSSWVTESCNKIIQLATTLSTIYDGPPKGGK